MSARATLLGYDDTQTVTDRQAAAQFAATHPPGTWNPYNRSYVTAGHYTSPLVRGVVVAGLTYGAGLAAADAFAPAPTSLPSTTAPLSTLTAPTYEPDIYQPEAPPVSIFSTISDALGIAGQAAQLYRQYDAARGGAVVQPAAMTSSILQPLTLGALPAIGAAAGAVGMGAVRLGVAGARAVANSAMTYCRRHPQWCATIGGTTAVAALIDSGQLPRLRRRRGRGITPKDLRSFKRVANLIRVFCPTVRRIPSRATRGGKH